MTPGNYPEHLNALLLAVFINAAIGGVCLAAWLATMAIKYYRDLQSGINGLSRSMFLFFLALAVEHLLLSLAFGGLLIRVDITIPRVLIAGGMFLFFLAMIYLHLETHRGN